MALIGSFAASSSAVFNLDFLPEKFLIGNTNSANQALSNLSVVCSGTQLMSITDVDRLTALAKFDSGACLSDPSAANVATTASYLRLATGRINKAATITGTNGTASAVNVFAASTNITNVARRAVEQSINPSANATFDNFEALFFLTANVLRAQITFANGFTDEYTPSELRALYANYHVSDEGGLLEGLCCIDADSGAGLISQVVIFNGSGGSTVVLKSDYVQL
jgi:hypothetical protein